VFTAAEKLRIKQP